MVLPQSLLCAQTYSIWPRSPSFQEVQQSIPLYSMHRGPYTLLRQPIFSWHLLLRESSDLLLAKETFNWIFYELCKEANNFQLCNYCYLFSSQLFHKEAGFSSSFLLCRCTVAGVKIKGNWRMRRTTWTKEFRIILLSENYYSTEQFSLGYKN